MNNTAKSRFYEVMDLLDLTDYRVYTDVENITKNMMVKLRKGETEEVSIKILIPFCTKFDCVNSEYILTGRGKPLKEEITKEEVDTKDNTSGIPLSSGLIVDTEEDYKDAIEDGLRLLPEVDFKFAAGQVSLLNGSEDITRYWHLPDCRDCEGVAQVVGNSMTPALPSGCWVALKRYPLPNENPNTIPFGHIFGVVLEDKDTGEYHGYIKVLRRYKEQTLSRKYWIAQSINKDEFDDFDIEIGQVRSLWIVKQHIVSDI